jgi:histone acetyltransferase (RNA polymerase elongator complex component)
MIKERGFELVGQMMTGLPGSSLEKDLYTAHKICDMGASGARIYPTVVFKDTELERMMVCGEYESREMETVVDEGAQVLGVFVERGVKVIRIGLQASELLTEGSEISSPYHEATGELIWSRYYRNMAEKLLENVSCAGKTVTITVPRGDVSKMTGQKKSNTEYLTSKFALAHIKVRESLADDCKIYITMEERKKNICG